MALKFVIKKNKIKMGERAVHQVARERRAQIAKNLLFSICYSIVSILSHPVIKKREGRTKGSTTTDKEQAAVTLSGLVPLN